MYLALCHPFDIQDLNTEQLQYIRRFCASWLIAYHHGLQWKDGTIPYNEAKRLITMAVFEDDVVVYVKGRKKRTWLRNLLLDDEREPMYIKTLDAVYEDMESLSNLDVTNIICGQHTVSVCMLNDATLIRLDSSSVRITMTEMTLRRMFDFNGCIDVTFERLARLVDTIDTNYTRFSNIASENIIRDSDIFSRHQLVDCELLALVFNKYENRCNKM
ncbi:hypothetical protein G5I_07450 [Acromyrmex echinatior]|uniref:Uncharacterized protein n=1 Tax=Acromyrmex echinatior TaxID=103372 RepID=F4WNU3_ACREC|nr:hypothetical protein G5I_07450 [Acromyrmex echinatior]